MDVTVLGARLRELLPEWRHADLAIAPLDGGITNANFRVDVAGESYVVRVEAPSSAGLAIDREQEWHNTAQAASRGLAPRPLQRFDQDQLSVREFLAGRSLSAAELRTPGNPTRIATLLRRLHGGPAFRGEFDLAQAAGRWVATVQRAGWPTPPDYSARREGLARLQAALGPRPVALAPCHNDLLAENFLEVGQDWRLIDFEYSGNNDPTFELGNLCRELDFNNAAIDELCQAYFDAPTEREAARVRLNMLLSDVGWSLWAVVQEHASAVEFNYAEYGLRRWQRAAEVLDSTAFSSLERAARSLARAKPPF
ncbi:MAG: phosphotransferase family protein [Pirellulales bacterium]|nr:phosphotransferase family protein [Pirellulales bacterium]